MKHLRLGSALLVLLLLSLCPAAAFATCTLSGNKETVSMAITSPITINPSWTVGTVIATSAVTTPSPSSSTVTCSGNNTQIGVYNLVGAQGTSSSTVFPTGVAGVGYQILHPDSSYILPAYPYDSISSGTYTLSVASALQLVVTGTITAGTTLNAATLGYWQYAGSRGSLLRTEDFVLGNAVTFVAPTCTVTTPTIAVTLPTVSNTALRTVGATAGATPFNIGLNCPAGAVGRNIALQFDTASQPTGTTGVIKPNTTSTATNVGVQLEDSSFNPITFGTAKTVGSAVQGTNTFTYYAQYYALTTAVGAGTISATATFTVTYP